MSNVCTTHGAVRPACPKCERESARAEVLDELANAAAGREADPKATIQRLEATIIRKHGAVTDACRAECTCRGMGEPCVACRIRRRVLDGLRQGRATP